MNHPVVTLIIAMRNEERHVASACLEVVGMNGSSTDRTPAIVAEPIANQGLA